MKQKIKSTCVAALFVVGISIAGNCQAQTFLTNGLVAYYPFKGNANDATGNGHDGTTNNVSLATDRFGNVNSCYSFNGSSSYITISNTSSLSPTGSFSVSFWVMQNSTSYPEIVISKSLSGDNSAGWFVAFEPPYNGYQGGIQFQAAPDFNPSEPSITPLGLNKWYQACYTYTGSNGLCNAYLNGALVDSVNNFYSSSVSPRNLTIGAQEYQVPGQYNYFFSGKLDDFRIYNRALATNEVAQLYAIESAPVVSLTYAVKPTFSALAIGTNYQLQVSTSVTGTFTNFGSPFTATNNSMSYSQYFDVANWNQLFFRLTTSP